MIRQSRDIVKAWNVVMVTLVNTQQSQEVRPWRVGSGAPLALSKRRVEVVALADNGSFAGFERLIRGLEVDEAARKLQVGVSDCFA